jgi:hypothetical protein
MCGKKIFFIDKVYKMAGGHPPFLSQKNSIRQTRPLCEKRTQEVDHGNLQQIVSIFLPKVSYACLYIQHLSVQTEVAKTKEAKETISAIPTSIASSYH